MKHFDIVEILDNVKSANILLSNRPKDVIDLNDEIDVSETPLRKLSALSEHTGDETSKKEKGEKLTSKNAIDRGDSDVIATEMGLNHTKNNLSALNDTKNLVDDGSVIDIEDMRDKIKMNVNSKGRSRTSPNKIFKNTQSGE